MQDWLSYTESDLDELLRMEGLSNIGAPEGCSTCGGHDAHYRCRDCTGGELLCRECVKTRHTNMPLHRIEVSLISPVDLIRRSSGHLSGVDGIFFRKEIPVVAGIHLPSWSSGDRMSRVNTVSSFAGSRASQRGAQSSSNVVRLLCRVDFSQPMLANALVSSYFRSTVDGHNIRSSRIFSQSFFPIKDPIL